MKFAIYLIGIFLISCALYVRLASSSLARWHVSITATQDQTLKSGAIRVLEGDIAAFEELNAAMRALPRTRVLAGSLEEKHITYISRSALWGFPDYTTLEHKAGVIKLFARLRFGKSDFGVNAKRLEVLLAVLK